MIDNSKLAKVTEQCRALILKAQSSTFDEEAEAFFAKAQELMTKYSIEESMLRAAGEREDEKVTRTVINTSKGQYATCDHVLVNVIALANDCRAYIDHGLDGKHMVVVGFPEDLRNVEFLYASLLVQLERKLDGAVRFNKGMGFDTSIGFRRGFRLGFADRVGTRLKDARAHVVAEAAKDDGSLLPVLADKSAQVKAALPPLGKSRRSAGGTAAGTQAGRHAAEGADVGSARMQAGRMAIGAGR